MRTFDMDTGMTEEPEVHSSLTYAMKEERVEGYTDGLEAVKQAVNKILHTEQYEYPIYSFSYGVGLQKLIGKEYAYVQAELPRMIEEALLTDGRIKEVSGFQFSFEGDICRCSFQVRSLYGTVTGNLEVKV